MYKQLLDILSLRPSDTGAIVSFLWGLFVVAFVHWHLIFTEEEQIIKRKKENAIREIQENMRYY